MIATPQRQCQHVASGCCARCLNPHSLNKRFAKGSNMGKSFAQARWESTHSKRRKPKQ